MQEEFREPTPILYTFRKPQSLPAVVEAGGGWGGVERSDVRVSDFWVVEVVEAGGGDGDDDGGGGVRVRVSGELQCTPDHKRGGGLGTFGGQVRCGRQRR
jgi:hypothetical protein